jgi:hypothetical protein
MQGQNSIDFIGIGAARSGTTWLSECLRQHPDILFPKNDTPDAIRPGVIKLKGEKELDFFIRGYEKNLSPEIFSNNSLGLDWYLAQFPSAQPNKVRGEFSPTYMADPDSAKLIRDTFPNIKLIVSLRNPVDMIYSLYWWQVYNFRLRGEVHEHNYSFEQAIGRGYFLERGLFLSNYRNTMTCSQQTIFTSHYSMK